MMVAPAETPDPGAPVLGTTPGEDRRTLCAQGSAKCPAVPQQMETGPEPARLQRGRILGMQASQAAAQRLSLLASITPTSQHLHGELKNALLITAPGSCRLGIQLPVLIPPGPATPVRPGMQPSDCSCPRRAPTSTHLPVPAPRAPAKDS